MNDDEFNRRFRAFIRSTDQLERKIQFGVRRRKYAEDWIAVDLYDQSELIDHNWDIHDLPLEDQSVDAYVCNAVLEHVEEPMLAIYEMHRTLKVGGKIWVGVPFVHPVHGAPNDYLRWTVAGLKRWMCDFEESLVDFNGGCEYEAMKFFDTFHKEKKTAPVLEHRGKIADYVTSFEEQHGESEVIYRSVFYSGTKTKPSMAPEKTAYCEYLKRTLRARPHQLVSQNCGSPSQV